MANCLCGGWLEVEAYSHLDLPISVNIIGLINGKDSYHTDYGSVGGPYLIVGSKVKSGPFRMLS